jgi:hypothetical protein
LIDDKAIPTAAVSSPTHTDDESIVENSVSHTLHFTRPAASAETPGTVADTVGYGLYLTNSQNQVKRQLENKTLAEVGGSAGAVTTVGFRLDNLAIDAGDRYLLIAFNSDGYALSQYYTYLTIVDYAAPLAVATGLIVTNDTNFDALVVTNKVSFIRAAASVESRGSTADTAGYGLYLRSSGGVLGSQILFKTLGELGGSPGTRVNFPFTITDLTISTGDLYQIYSLSVDTRSSSPANSYVQSLTGSALHSTLDEAIPVVAVSDIVVTADTDTIVNSVTQTISFTRPSDEGTGTVTEVLGYKLYLLSTDSSQTLVESKTLSQLSAGNSFSVTSLVVKSTDVYQIVAYSRDGDSSVSTTAAVGDKAIPIAVARGMTVASDTNLLSANLTHAISFTRARLSVETPENAEVAKQATLGYRLFLTGNTADCPNQVGCQQLQQVSLGDLTSTSTVESAFVIDSLVITPGDVYMIFTYNNDGNAATGISASTADRATPLSVAADLSVTADQNTAVHLITLDVSFRRDTVEATGATADPLGYELWVQHTNGVQERRVQRTLSELGGSSGSVVQFQLVDFGIEQGDVVLIYSYNNDGTSAYPSDTIAIEDAALPIAVVSNVALSQDTNPLLYNVTMVVTYTRPAASVEDPGTSEVILGYELYIVRSTGVIDTLLFHLTTAQLASQSEQFIFDNLAISAGDQVQIFSWNSYGTSATGSPIVVIPDQATPVFTPFSLTQSVDTQLNFGVVTQAIRFKRTVSEAQGVASDVESYALYHCRPGGYHTKYANVDTLVDCTILQQLDLQHFDDLSDNVFQVEELSVQEGDVYQIRGVNSYGVSFFHGEISVDDEAAPLGWYETITATLRVEASSVATADVTSATASVLGISVNNITTTVTTDNTCGAGSHFFLSVNVLPEDSNATQTNLLASVASGDLLTAINTANPSASATLVEWCVDPVVIENIFRASNLTQTVDQDVDYDDVSMSVSFVRAKDEGTSIVAVLGYLLYIGIGDQRAQLVANKTILQLGGSPGTFVTSPYELRNYSLSGNLNFFVVSYSQSGIAFEGNHIAAAVNDLAVPLAVATDLTTTPDINLNQGFVTQTVSFSRAVVEHTGLNRQTEGYRLYLTNGSFPEEGMLQIGSSTLAALGGLPGGVVESPFDLLSINIAAPKYEAYALVAFNSIGDSRTALVVDIVDRVRPTEVVSNIRFTDDIDSRKGYVTLNVTFERASNEDNIVGYRLFLLNLLSRVKVIGDKAKDALGGGAGSLVTSGFELTGEDIQEGTNLVSVVAYNLAGDALNSAIERLPDVGLADFVPPTCTFVDEDPQAGFIGGTVNISSSSHPNDVVFGIYLGSGGTTPASKASKILLTVAPDGDTSRAFIPLATPIQTQTKAAQHILVFSQNTDGTASQGVSCMFTDLTSGPPASGPSSVTITTDTNAQEDVISGTITVGRAADEADIEEYTVYMATSAGIQGYAIANISKHATTLEATVTDVVLNDATRLLAFTRNVHGLSTASASGIFTDDTGDNPARTARSVVLRVDDNSKAGFLSGVIEIQPASSETDVVDYVVYLGGEAPSGFVASSVNPVLVVQRSLEFVSVLYATLPRLEIGDDTHVLVRSRNANGEGSTVAFQFADTAGEGIRLASSSALRLEGSSALAINVKTGPPWPWTCQQAKAEHYLSEAGQHLDGGFYLAQSGSDQPRLAFCNQEDADGGWELVANVPGWGPWLSVRSGTGSAHAAFTADMALNTEAHDPREWDHDVGFLLPFNDTDVTQVMFLTGDKTVMCVLSLADVRQQVNSTVENSEVAASRGAAVSPGLLTNVLNDGVTATHPYIGCEGRHARNMRHLMWAEGGKESYATLKNSHGGVGVFVR